MNFINALSWPQWLLLLAIPPAVLSLYFLKLRRKPIEVPSTLLWKKSLEDLHVNSIWQRLRNSLLLYLQLLFLGLIIFACLRPGWSGSEQVGEKRIYMLDQSASMLTSDADPNRLEASKEAIRSLIQNSSDDDVGMLIAFSDRADVRQGFTKDKNKLIAALESVSATNRTTNFTEAIRSAAALAIPAKDSGGSVENSESDETDVTDSLPARVLLFSDGGFVNADDPNLDKLPVDFYSVGDASTSNIAILSFAVQKKEGTVDQMEAFARLASYGGVEATFTASLEIDGELADATTVKMASNSETGIVFELSALQQGELKLSLDAADSSPIDNVAYAAVRPPRRIKVLLVSPGNSALEAAMNTDRCRQISDVEVQDVEYLQTPEYELRQKQGDFELVVFDRCAPAAMPLANTLFIGVKPPKITPQLTGNETATDMPAKETQASIDGPQNASNEDTTNQEKDRSSVNTDAEPKDVAGTQNVDKESYVVDEWKTGEASGPVIILDVDRSHPITQYLEMNSVIIVEGMTVTPPEGGKVLMSSDSGPVFGLSPRGPFQDAVLGFSVVVNENTDWGLRRSFPVFVYSSIETLGGGAAESSADSVRPGESIRVGLAPQVVECIVETPSGDKVPLSRGSDSRFLFTKTDELGIYKIYAEESNELLEAFCVNLFSSRESDVRAAGSIEMGAKAVAAETSTVRSRQEGWRWLILAGLALLILEWGIFNRRVFT
jgi:hypothetical protein